MKRLLYLLFLGFSPFLIAQDFDYQYHTIGDDLKKNANAVVRLDETHVNLEAADRMTVKSHRVVTVINKKGNRNIKASLGYNDAIKVKTIEAKIYNSSGSQIKRIKKSDFEDVSAVDGGTLYTDSRVIYMDYTPTEYPYTVDFTYEFTTKNTSLIPSWYFIGGYHVSYEKSLYTVAYSNPSLKPIIKERNLEDLELLTEESGDKLVYEARMIPAIKPEVLCPSLVEMAPSLMVRTEDFFYEGHFGKVKNWREMGHWINQKLLMGRDDLPEETIRAMRNLVSAIPDTLERARKVYEYVQDNTRYISVQVGIGGIQPISAIDVDRVKYGDCKGLSNYTKALLKAVGVESYYVHVEAGNRQQDFEENFPDLKQGNHVILAIPYRGEYYWIDCTSQVHPFGFLGDFTDDRRVLLMKPDGGEIAFTPKYADETNYQFTTALGEIDENGNLSATVEIKTGGIQYDDRFKLEEESDRDVGQHYKNYWDYLNGVAIKSYSFNNDKRSVEFKEKIDVGAGSYVLKTGDNFLFTPNAFNRNTYVPPRYRNRKLPLEISRGYLDEDEFKFKLPQGYTVKSLPEDREITSDYGEYYLDIDHDVERNEINLKRKLLIRKGNYPKESYAEYRAFRKKVASLDNAKIVLTKKPQ